MRATPSAFENHYCAELANSKEKSTLEEHDNRHCGSVAVSHEPRRPNSQCEREEAKSDFAAKNSFSDENERAGILEEICTRLDRMESINSEHRDLSQKHILENQEVILNLTQGVADIKAALTNIQKAISNFSDDVGNVHGLLKSAEVAVGLQGQSGNRRSLTSTGKESVISHPGSEATPRNAARRLSLKEARAALEKFDTHPHLVDKSNAAAKKGKRGDLFTDISLLKQQVRESILQPYNVSQYYHRGVCARIAMHPNFEISALVVIALNAIWLGIDVDINGSEDTPDKDIAYQCIDYSFFTFFVAEILVRFGAFARTLDCLKDFWFTFDSALVALMCFDTILPLVADNGLGFDTSLITLFRLLKLSRMGRIATVLLKVPEISIFLRGFGIACRSVICLVFLMLCIVYVFAVALRYLTIDSDLGERYFQTVPVAVRGLAIKSAFLDAADMIEDIGMENVPAAVLVIIFFCIVSLTMLNFLVGMLCEVVGVLAAVEKERTRVHMVKDRLSQVLRASSNDHIVDGCIGQHEFQTMLLDAEVARTLRDLDVDPVGVLDYVYHIFRGGHNMESYGQSEQALNFDKVVHLICELGGSNVATVNHVVDMRQVVIRHLVDIEDSLDELMHAHREVAPLQSVGADNHGPRASPSYADAATRQDSQVWYTKSSLAVQAVSTFTL